MKIKKLLGKLARLLLAIDAQKWQEGPGIKVQALAGADLPLDAQVLLPKKHDEGIVSQGTVVIPATAPNTVVTPVIPAPEKNLTAKKSLEQVLLVLYAFIGWAALTLLDALLAGGVIEKLGLPQWVSVPALYGLLNAIREQARRKHNEERSGK